MLILATIIYAEPPTLFFYCYHKEAEEEPKNSFNAQKKTIQTHLTAAHDIIMTSSRARTARSTLYVLHLRFTFYFAFYKFAKKHDVIKVNPSANQGHQRRQ